MAEASETQSINPEELQNNLRLYVPEHALARERDMLSGRYRLLMAEPLPQFNSTMAKAFVARDIQDPNLPLYALVFDSTAIPRKKNITALKTYRHPNLLSLHDEGVVDISSYSESRYVVIMDQPAGQSLAELLSAQQKNPIGESIVISHMMRPFTEILKAFQGMGISHNRINLANVYLTGGTIMMGECVSEPSGYSQAFLFEPIDRLLASAWGKQDFNIDADCYALGVLALHLLLGYQPYANATREDFIASVLARGSYHTLVIQWDISEHFQDLFRALLNNSKRDRSTPDYIEYWLTGKSFNLILPAVAQETARPFDFAGQNYYNRKSLAHALYTHWDEGRALLFDSRLQRWIETALHKKDVAEQVARVTNGNMGDTPKGEKHNNELLGRIIILLDPTGPIRFKSLSFFLEGIGGIMAHNYITGDQIALQELIQAIECDLPGWWVEQQKGTGDYNPAMTRIQKMRNFLRIRGPGFGIERCLYDALPLLMCQSPLVKRLGVLTLQDVFFALDTVAVTQRATETDFMDAHIAAFIASRLELGKEIRIHELDAIRELASNPRLASIKMLGRVQYSTGMKRARGLTHWIVLRLFNLSDYIHKRDMRHHMQRQLQAAADSGMIEAVSNVLLNPDMFVHDFQAFKKAQQGFAHRQHQIKQLQNPGERKRHARMVGRGLAQTLAYGTCCFTIYFTLRSYYHF